MDSHEILKGSIKPVGAKSVARDMNLSTSMVYKWCETADDGGGGADNPLDRILKICQLTDSVAPVEWLCRQTGSFRVENPKNQERQRGEVLRSTQSILKEFTELLNAVSQSFDGDNEIDPEEAQRIRKEWEDLKAIAESFVLACEEGIFDGNAPEK